VSSPALGHPRIGGEVARIHPFDGSMHMVCSPADAASVIEAGWGERHSPAGRGKLPATYLMIYAPRSSAEATVIAQLLAASIGYVLHTPSR
jgi:hypothetical protein